MASTWLYRPGLSAVTEAFFAELSSYLDVFALYKCPIVVAGDYNIRAKRVGDADATRLQDLSSFDCIQQVPLTPTHCGGGTLDLVVTKSDQVLEEMTVYPPSIISDYSVISWRCPLPTQPRIVMNREVRGWTKLDHDSFRSALLESEFCSSEQRPVTADEYFDFCHRVLTRLADQYAPVKRVTLRRQRLALWMDEECRRLRRKSRMLERRYRRSNSIDDRFMWVQQERERHKVYLRKEKDYWSTRVCGDAKHPRQLWRSLNTLMGASEKNTLLKNCPSAQQFADFFDAKVAAVRRATSGGDMSAELPPATEAFDHFQRCNVSDVQSAIMIAPSKSCTLDPLPTDILLPFVTDLCNASLLQGYLPLSQRHAIIRPRLKKAGSDPSLVQNYRPVSNLTFMSKIVERLVCHQLVAFFERLRLLPSLQSAYGSKHSRRQPY